MKSKNFLSIAVLSLVFLFGFKKTAIGGWDLLDVSGFGLPDPIEGIYGIISNILDWLLTLVGIAGVIGFIISGLMYLTSAGDDAKMKTAKSAMMASIYGVIVALSGVVVVTAVDYMLNADYLF
ncbi:MAG TPA: hypothetical protein DCS28_03585 [Candidatus Moranbacteria bacterium]|nr:hypothetical protein [Candidatus Moranbacteria bacterium]HAT75094.1 hypothetical protein [Candidatus Moranbacteria bacterium]